MPGPASAVPPRRFVHQQSLLGIGGTGDWDLRCRMLRRGLGCAISARSLPLEAMSLRPAVISRKPLSSAWCSGTNAQPAGTWAHTSLHANGLVPRVCGC